MTVIADTVDFRGRLPEGTDRAKHYADELAMHNAAIAWLAAKLDNHRNSRNRVARLLKEELERRVTGGKLPRCSAYIGEPSARRQKAQLKALRKTSAEDGRCLRAGPYKGTDGKHYCGHHFNSRVRRSA